MRSLPLPGSFFSNRCPRQPFASRQLRASCIAHSSVLRCCPSRHPSINCYHRGITSVVLIAITFVVIVFVLIVVIIFIIIVFIDIAGTVHRSGSKNVMLHQAKCQSLIHI